MKLLFAACLCLSLYFAVAVSTPYFQQNHLKGAENVRKEPSGGRAELLPYNLVSVDAVIRRCVHQQAKSYVADRFVTPSRLCAVEKAFLQCFHVTVPSEGAKRAMAVLRSLVLGQHIATVMPFCGTVNDLTSLRDVNKHAAGDCTILDVQQCLASVVFSQASSWTPCLVQPVAFGCYMRECLGPQLGSTPNLIGTIMAYHLNSTYMASGLCAHMESSPASNEYDYYY